MLEGWSPPARTVDWTLRQRFEDLAREHGSHALHKQLAEIDPVSADRIDHRNLRRVIRALEIYHATGIPASQQRKAEPPPYDVLRIGLTLPRKELYARIDARIAAMIDAGLVEEVQRLLDRGLNPDLPAMTAIGYRQIVDHFKGNSSLEDAVKAMRRATRQFVRRQANWFKMDDPKIQWFEAREDVVDLIVAFIGAWQANAGNPNSGYV
jgi:tRNA dimethylallyltransferase